MAARTTHFRRHREVGVAGPTDRRMIFRMSAPHSSRTLSACGGCRWPAGWATRLARRPIRANETTILRGNEFRDLLPLGHQRQSTVSIPGPVGRGPMARDIDRANRLFVIYEVAVYALNQLRFVTIFALFPKFFDLPPVSPSRSDINSGRIADSTTRVNSFRPGSSSLNCCLFGLV